MKIITLRRQPPVGNTLAVFDAEIAPGVKAYRLRLVQARTGLRVFGPSIAGGGAAATFAPAIADKIAELAMGDVAHHESAD